MQETSTTAAMIKLLSTFIAACTIVVVEPTSTHAWENRIAVGAGMEAPRGSANAVAWYSGRQHDDPLGFGVSALFGQSLGLSRRKSTIFVGPLIGLGYKKVRLDIAPGLVDTHTVFAEVQPKGEFSSRGPALQTSISLGAKVGVSFSVVGYRPSVVVSNRAVRLMAEGLGPEPMVGEIGALFALGGGLHF